MDSAIPIGPSPSISDGADSLRRWIGSLVLYVELWIRLLALESKEPAVHLLVLAALFVCAPRTLCWLSWDAHRFSSLPADADLSLGMGLERIGLRRGVAHYQYRCGRTISVSDHQPAFPNHFCRILKRIVNG
jgi:hypothetical protein